MRANLKKSLALGSALLVLGLAPHAFAQDNEPLGPNVQLEMRFGENNVYDSSYDALDDDDLLSTFTIAVGTDLGRYVPGLRAGLHYEATAHGTTDFDDSDVYYITAPRVSPMNLSWQRSRFMATADWGWTVLKFLRPAARIGAGYSLQELAVELNGGSQLTDNAHDLALQGSALLEAAAPIGSIRGNAIRVGANFEYGYQFQTTATFDELGYAEGEDPNDGWTRETPNLGSLDTNGTFWNFGILANLSF